MSNRPTKFSDLQLHDENSYAAFTRQYSIDTNRLIRAGLKVESHIGVRKSDKVEVVIKKVNFSNSSARASSASDFLNSVHIIEGRAVPKEYDTQLKASRGNPGVVKPLEWFENDNENGYVLVTEHHASYMSMSDFIVAYSVEMPELLAKPIFKSALTSVIYCHLNGVGCLDLQARNVLVHWPTRHVKIGAFGFARQHLAGEHNYGVERRDVNALGSLLYEMLHRKKLKLGLGKNAEEVMERGPV